MQITVYNGGTTPVPFPGANETIDAGETRTFTDRTEAEYLYMVTEYASEYVRITGQVEPEEDKVLVIDLKGPTDPDLGYNVLAACGFDIEDLAGTAFSTVSPFWIGIYTNAACTTLATGAKFSAIATGTFVSGLNENLAKVTPVAGQVSLTIYVPSAGTYYVKAWAAELERVLDGSETHAPVFTAAYCQMKDPGNNTAPISTVAAVGLDLLDGIGGSAANSQLPMILEVFSDAACTTLSTHATMNTASVGAITAGAGTNSVSMTPDAAGEAALTVTADTAGTYYVKARPAAAASLVTISAKDTVLFTGFVAQMKNPGDNTAPVCTIAGVGFDFLAAFGGAPYASQRPMIIECFDDAACTVLSVASTLNTATEGVITAGAGTNSVTITPSAAGVVALTLTATAAATYYVKARPVTAADLIGISAKDTAVFTGWYCQMKDPGNPGAGVTTMAGVGFDFLDGVGGAPYASQRPMIVEVFDDAGCTVPAVHATLNTATTGAITGGAGTNAIAVTPSAAGIFACTCTDATLPETVYVLARPATATDLIDLSAADQIVYTP